VCQAIRNKKGLIQKRETWRVAGFPRFELASHVFPSRQPQFRGDSGMLRGQPVLKFVERFDGRENGGRDFNGFRFHGGSLTRIAGNSRSAAFVAFKIDMLLSVGVKLFRGRFRYTPFPELTKHFFVGLSS
jgi:hypothetical protein